MGRKAVGSRCLVATRVLVWVLCFGGLSLVVEGPMESFGVFLWVSCTKKNANPHFDFGRGFCSGAFMSFGQCPW